MQHASHYIIPNMKSFRTTVSLSKNQLQALQQMAESSGVSVSWLIRQAVASFLTEHKEEFHPLKNKADKSERGIE
ncbi:CopG family transcriptional regulator [uncultured Kosakonia sp.]|uniref:ribbon-helix-helix domain-containing protein n=1 Tax=uncultured Kosakonia sp. TaxID=1588927 RepID=UPI0025926004|nr:CopG family transcriptional regulator [uncultured Kosakonia sp.]